MGQDHSSAAVALKAQHVKGLPKGSLRRVIILGINFVLLEKVKVLVPLVADNLKYGIKITQTHFATGKASDWDDHFSESL